MIDGSNPGRSSQYLLTPFSNIEAEKVITHLKGEGDDPHIDDISGSRSQLKKSNIEEYTKTFICKLLNERYTGKPTIPK